MFFLVFDVVIFVVVTFSLIFDIIQISAPQQRSILLLVKKTSNKSSNLEATLVFFLLVRKK